MTAAIGQLFIIGVSGKTLNSEEKKFISTQSIGGVVLFSRNYEGPEQLFELTKEIQSLSKGPPLWIAIDMEGGRVTRLKAPFTAWPAMQRLGEIDSPTLSFQFAQALGAELRAAGINLNFAPCLDVFTNPANTVIGDRAISSDPEIVAKHASALVRGFIKSNIVACAKHFPGHGDTLVDSHDDLPVHSADLSALENREIVPFKRAIKSHVEMIMTAHVKYETVDPSAPASLSAVFQKKILRESLRYKGLIISDDLDMHAITKNYDTGKVPVLALRAGTDLLLYCNDPATPPLAIESVTKALRDGQLAEAEISDRVARITALKQTRIAAREESWQSASKVIGSQEHALIRDAMVTGNVSSTPTD